MNEWPLISRVLRSLRGVGHKQNLCDLSSPSSLACDFYLALTLEKGHILLRRALTHESLPTRKSRAPMFSSTHTTQVRALCGEQVTKQGSLPFSCDCLLTL